MGIEISIPEIIDGTACSSHYQRAGEEEQGGGEDGEGGRGGVRGCHEGGEEAGEEEVIGSGWFVEADEFGVGNP